jgi:hypothetical protein
VDHDPGLGIPLGVAVTRDVVAFIPDFDLTIETFDELPRQDRA